MTFAAVLGGEMTEAAAAIGHPLPIHIIDHKPNGHEIQENCGRQWLQRGRLPINGELRQFSSLRKLYLII